MTDPGGLLLAYYGDDFTGSNDVMEALVRVGVPTVLFMQPPGPEQMARFGGLRAVGVAGVSRSLPVEEMDAELRPVFAALRGLGTPLVHYKVCSTFDSSPEVGSIGRAIDLGQSVLSSPYVPLVVGAPRLGRYTAFGNLFARSGPESEVFRLDRHPTMSRHPTTPMREADLRLHLARQTGRRIGLLDASQLSAPGAEPEGHLAASLAAGEEVVLFDVVTDEHLPVIGRLLWQESRADPLFAVGSAGVEYALAAYWKRVGLLPEFEPGPPAGPVEQVVAVCGSCSPVSERQIDRAVQDGFAEIPLDPARLLDPGRAEAEVGAVTARALKAAAGGRSVVVHSCRGPDDPRIVETARRGGLGTGLKTARVVGEALGMVLREVLAQTGIRRAAVAGGDTSGYAARRMRIEALEVKAPFGPAMPLCRAHAPGQALDGLEIVFKGGQTGRVDFFGGVRRGKP